MPVIGPLLGTMITSKIRENIKAKFDGHDPMNQKNPAYFIQFGLGIAMGFMDSTKSIAFTTEDKGLPVNISNPGPGIGVGTGINTNAEYMSEQMYTNIRNKVKQMADTMHDPWPPTPGNSGEALRAITDAIADSVHEHYSKALILSSTHLTLFTGKGQIMKGKFSGLIPQAVSAAILDNTKGFQGSMWPMITLAIAEAYVDTIHKESTGQVEISGGGPGSVPGVGTGAAT